MNWLRSWMMPSQGTPYAQHVDNVYLFITLVSAFCFFGIAAATLWWAWKYRQRGGVVVKTPYMTHNLALEITWSVIPLLVCVFLFFWGFHGYMNASIPPGDAMEIQVTGKKWLWAFEYPNGTRSIGDLHVPVNKPVKLVMSSEDVIHSFFVPTFRIKQDVLPNRYTELWFHPTEVGVHQAYCAEYCGKSHSDMLARIFVDTPEKYNEWLEKGDEQAQKMPLPELGKLVYENRGCAQCHSIDGSRGQGPSFKGIWGQQHKLTDGASVIVDANYIRESILNPQAKVAVGYEPVMPTFQGLLREREILGVIEYIKTLQ
jgi:cytochrome c oxidase subunit 2